MKNVLKDKNGFSLVETIIGVALLAIACIMLVNGFVSTANIVNRATSYKASSAEVAAAIELEGVEPSSKLITADNYVKSDVESLKIIYSVGNAVNTSELIVKGKYCQCTDPKMKLTYREFLGSNYVNTTPITD